MDETQTSEATVASVAWCADMQYPLNSECLPFPVHMKPWIVAVFKATREDLRAVFGPPHYVETDGTRTFGGDEDNWAWQLESGERVLIVLRVPYDDGVLYCDPPDAHRMISVLGIDSAKHRLQILPTPLVDPCYSGP